MPSIMIWSTFTPLELSFGGKMLMHLQVNSKSISGGQWSEKINNSPEKSVQQIWHLKLQKTLQVNRRQINEYLQILEQIQS